MSDARDAYIAGRSGGSRPSRSSSPSSLGQSRSEEREQQAYDAGRQERERAQRAAITKQQGVGAEGGLTSEELQQARNIASGKGGIDTFKDPYNVLTRQEEIAAGFPQTGMEKLFASTGINVPNLTLQGLGVGAKTLQGLLDKVFKPEAKDFNNPQFLAVLKREIDAGRVNKDSFISKYKSLIDKAYEGFDSGATMGLDSDEILDLQLDQASNLSEQGILGAGSQRINFPEEFYTGDQTKTTSQRTPQTSGGLVDLAGLDAQKYLSGPDYNPELAQMIFDARAELNRQGRNAFTGTKDSPADSPAFTQPGGPAQPPGTNPPGTPPTTPPQQPGQPFFPFPSTGIASIFNPAFMGPSFDPRMAEYTRQGLGDRSFDQFYRNLELFPKA
tara:strand:+ start:5171 stop:6331 length:1161 start_codon:yes stop_codon:yes gene_type:complete